MHSKQRLTPRWVWPGRLRRDAPAEERAEELGIRLSLSLRFADSDLERGDTTRWEEVLRSGATMFTTDHSGALLELIGRWPEPGEFHHALT